jgi:metal-responsive CopG/Arc/MetJ family transcriptional regulator
MARPKKYKNIIHLTVSMERSLKDEFEKMASREGRSMSELLQDWISTEVSNYKKLARIIEDHSRINM